MSSPVQKKVRAFLFEFVVYAILVAVYYLLVLHLMGDWLNDLFRRHRGMYAAAALGLIIGQGVLLDVMTHLLVAFFKTPGEDE